MTDFFDLDAQEQAARLRVLAVNALRQWGVADSDPRLIKYRENAVFEVKTADGERAALRVHRQGYHSADSLKSELNWMAMLAEGGIATPRPIATRSGAMIVDASAEGAPGAWKVDMLSWLSGRQLGAVGSPLELEGRDVAALFFRIGECMGKLHNLSVAWPQQNAQTRPHWDRDGFVGEAPLWGRFWELAALSPSQKRLFLDAKAALREDLDRYGRTQGNYGLIHADLVPENILLNGDAIELIDFDDAGFGWHMFEIVTAIYWLAEEPAFDTIRSSVLRGYQAARPLSPRDLDAMEMFYAARSLTYLGWVHTRSQTETAVELTPIMIEVAEKLCADYIARRRR
ncbi:MAG: phosphotransferase [Pseudomonadota bacterium]|nr:phosphotransferase [Pseudomonadota bacterium]